MWEIAPFVNGHPYLYLDDIDVIAKEEFRLFSYHFQITTDAHKYLREKAYRDRIHYVEFRGILSFRQAVRRKLYLCP